MDNDQSPMQKFRSFYEEMILLLDALSASNNQQESENTLFQMALVMEELERWERSSKIVSKQRELGSLLMRQLDKKVDRILDETGSHNEWGQRVHRILRRASNSISGIKASRWIDDEITTEDSTYSSGRPKSTDDSDDANQVVHQLSISNEKHDIEISEMEQESKSNYEEKDGDITTSDDHHAKPLGETPLVRQLTDSLKSLSANAKDLQRNQLERQKHIHETIQTMSNAKDEEIQKLKDTLKERDTEILNLQGLLDGSREQKWTSYLWKATAKLTVSKKQLDQVKKTLSQREEEVEDLKQKLQELDAQNKMNRVLQQQMTEANREINGLQKEMDRLLASLSQNKVEKLEMEKIAATQMDRALATENQLVSLQRNEDEYRQQIVSLQQQIENQNKAMSAMSKALEQHKALAAQQTNESMASPNERQNTLSNLFDVMDNEKMNKKTAAKVNELELDLNEVDGQLENLVARLRAEVNKLQSAFPKDGSDEDEDWEKRVGMRRESWIHRQNRKARRKRDAKRAVKDSYAELECITAEIVDIQEKVNSLWEMTKDEMDSNQEMNEELLRLNAELKVNEGDIEMLMQRVLTRDSEFEDYRQSLQVIVDDGDGDDNELSSRISAMEKEGEIRALNIRIADAEQQIKELLEKQKDHDVLVTNLEQLNEKLHDKDVQLKTLSDVQQLAAKTTAELKSAIKEMLEKDGIIEELRKELDKNTQNIEEGDTTIAMLFGSMEKEEECQVLQLRIDEAEQDIADLRRVIKAKDVHIESATNQVEDQRAIIRKVHSEMHILRETLVAANEASIKKKEGAQNKAENQKTEMNRAADDVRDDQMVSMFIEKEKTNELERVKLILNEKESELNEHNAVVTIGINRLRVETDQLLLALSEYVDSGADVSKTKEEVAERENTPEDNSVVIDEIADDLVSIRGEIVAAFSLTDMARGINAKEISSPSIANDSTSRESLRERNGEETSGQNYKAYAVLSILILSIIALVQNTDYWSNVDRDDEYSYSNSSEWSEGGQMDEDNELRLKRHVHVKEAEIKMQGNSRESDEEYLHGISKCSDCPDENSWTHLLTNVSLGLVCAILARVGFQNVG